MKPIGALVLFAALWVAAALATVPPAPPRQPPEGGFDLARALAHVERVAAEPHPAGSAAGEAVAAYLAGELEALGLEPEIRRATVESPPWLPVLPWLEQPEDASARQRIPLASVVARLRGAGGGRAVLLQAHHDSNPAAPGAGDDAAGVAAVLEAARVLAAEARERPFPNDLIVHLDDGEELGLLGARRFAEEDPWMADVRAVVNLDARGNAGSPILFETGPGSGALVRAFAAERPDAIGASLAAAVYARMRNDTSFTPFRERGLPGLNFACVGGASVYHRPEDLPENLSRRTLLRYGECALAAARAALALDLDAPPSSDPVFFNAVAGALVVHPVGWSYALALAPLALAARLAARARRRGIALARSAGRALLLLAAAFGTGILGWALARGLAAPLAGLVAAPERGNLASATLDAFGVQACAVAAALAAMRRLGARRDALDELALGGVLLWTALLAVLLAALSLASYAALWPLLFTLPATAAWVERKDAGPPGRFPALYAILAFALVATVLAPTFLLLSQVASIVPRRAALVAAALGALGALLFQPHLRWCTPRADAAGGARLRGFGPALLAGAAGLALLLAGALADAAGR